MYVFSRSTIELYSLKWTGSGSMPVRHLPIGGGGGENLQFGRVTSVMEIKTLRMCEEELPRAQIEKQADRGCVCSNRIWGANLKCWSWTEFRSPGFWSLQICSCTQHMTQIKSQPLLFSWHRQRCIIRFLLCSLPLVGSSSRHELC